MALVEREGIPYMVMGSLASRAWALPRTVIDLDLSLAAGEERLQGFCAAAERAGFYVPETHRQGYADDLQEMRRFSFKDVSAEPSIPVVCYLVATDYQRAAFDRRRPVTLGGREVWMISPEDLILHHLLIGSLRGLADIDDILLVQGTVDRDYLRTWASALGVTEVLEERLLPQ